MFQSETIRERLMHSLKERISKAREDSKRAELSKPFSMDTKDKMKIKEEITSPSTSSPSNHCSISSVNQGKQINRAEGPNVFHLTNLSLFDKILRKKNSSILE